LASEDRSSAAAGSRPIAKRQVHQGMKGRLEARIVLLDLDIFAG